MTPPPETHRFIAALPRFVSGADTPRDFLERCLARLSAFEPKIGAFVHTNIAGARAAADAATARWRAGKPLSRIDGMPIGIKDIIETADMPTEMGSPLFAGWSTGRDAASVAALRAAGALIVGKTVTTEFAASEPRGTRNPWDLGRTPGGSSSGSAAAVAAGFVSTAVGTQVAGSIIRPASFCGCIGFKPTVGAINRGGSHDYLSQSCNGVIGATLEDTWQVAYEISRRVGGDPGFPGLFGPEHLPAAARPRALALLETAGWEVAAPAAKAAINRALGRLDAAGVRILTRRDEARIAAVEASVAPALELTNLINAWEFHWPLNTYRERDATKLSHAMLTRLAEAESMSIEDYRSAIEARAKSRALYAGLATIADACITLSAPGPAPEGLESTGNPIFAAPGSFLGIPAVSLPVLSVDALPLGLQVMGFEHGDAAMLAAASWLQDRLPRADAS